MSDPLAPMPDLRGDLESHVPIVGQPALSQEQSCTVFTTHEGKYEVHTAPCPNIPENYVGAGQFNTTNPYEVVSFVHADVFSHPEMENAVAEQVLAVANRLMQKSFDISCSCCDNMRSQIRH